MPAATLPHSLRVEESHVPHQHASPVVANEHCLGDALAEERDRSGCGQPSGVGAGGAEVLGNV